MHSPVEAVKKVKKVKCNNAKLQFINNFAFLHLLLLFSKKRYFVKHNAKPDDISYTRKYSVHSTTQVQRNCRVVNVALLPAAFEPTHN